jgi:hypothetical protein
MNARHAALLNSTAKREVEEGEEVEERKTGLWCFLYLLCVLCLLNLPFPVMG